MAEPNLPDRDAVADREPLDADRDLPSEQGDLNDASVHSDPALRTPEPGDRLTAAELAERTADDEVAGR